MKLGVIDAMEKTHKVENPKKTLPHQCHDQQLLHLNHEMGDEEKHCK